MGNHFIIGSRFDRKSPEDFGLTSTEQPDVYLREEDGSLWIPRQLYDFGWGDEDGFYRLPMPKFDELVSIVLKAENVDDKYGAASVIIQDYCDELLDKCLEVFASETEIDSYLEFFTILKLDRSVNRSQVIGKSCIDIEKDLTAWNEVATRIADLLADRKHRGRQH